MLDWQDETAFIDEIRRLRQVQKQTLRDCERQYNQIYKRPPPADWSPKDPLPSAGEDSGCCSCCSSDSRRGKHTCRCCGCQSQRPATAEVWRPSVTIPQPFRMTIRDEAGLNTSSHSARCTDAYLQEKAKRAAEREAAERIEHRRPFRAHPIPASTFLPLYEERQRAQQERRSRQRERARQKLLQEQRPFSFSTPKRWQHARRCSSADSALRRDNTTDDERPPIHRTPTPWHILGDEVDREREQAEVERRRRIARRAKYLLNTSEYPPGLKRHEQRGNRQWRRHRNECVDRHSYRPRINRSVPDFKAAQEEFESNLESAKARSAQTTVPVPFDLERSQECVYHNFQTCVPPSPHSMRRAQSSTDLRVRRTSLYRRQYYEQLSRPRTRPPSPRQDEGETTVKYNPALGRELRRKQLVASERLRMLRNESRTRELEYRNQLADMKARVNDRPTIYDSQIRYIRRQVVERRYRSIVTQSGIDLSTIHAEGHAESLSEVDGLELPPSPSPMSPSSSSGAATPAVSSGDEEYGDFEELPEEPVPSKSSSAKSSKSVATTKSVSSVSSRKTSTSPKISTSPKQSATLKRDLTVPEIDWIGDEYDHDYTGGIQNGADWIPSEVGQSGSPKAASSRSPKEGSPGSPKVLLSRQNSSSKSGSSRNGSAKNNGSSRSGSAKNNGSSQNGSAKNNDGSSVKPKLLSPKLSPMPGSTPRSSRRSSNIQNGDDLFADDMAPVQLSSRRSSAQILSSRRSSRQLSVRRSSNTPDPE